MSEQADIQSAAPTMAGETVIAGVHHSARPTWKLGETVRFYRDVMGLELIHAISARGWGPEDHPDFIHFFFDGGNDSTLAFFYYLGLDMPPHALPQESWLYRSVHTAWRVETREQLLAWRARFEAHGLDVMQVKHEIIESIYAVDPNGYWVEITWQMRDLGSADADDARMTLEAAILVEEETGAPVQTIDEVWNRKAALVKAHIGREA
jgi:catechol 2,3-dioxygenase-like lactoylglutathione lyase family enzyme